MRNHEVTVEQKLLDESGEIAECGWARKPVWKYERRAVKAPALRIKEWDYYLVMHDGLLDKSESIALACTLSDDGYVGLQSVSLLFPGGEKPWEHTNTILNVAPMGRMHLPESAEAGDVRYRDKKLDLAYLKSPGQRAVQGTFRSFMDGKDLKIDLKLKQREEDDRMVIATPWDRKRAFYYNQKINGMRASGTVQLGDRTWVFRPETDFGTLDWGRGVWTYDNTWYWGSGNQDLNGHTFGFNIGFGFGNTKAATENVLFYDGSVSKLDDVEIRIPGDVSLKDMDAPRYMEPWEIHESSGRFEMTFCPVLDRAAKMDFKVIVSDQHQVFGRMSGTAVLSSGQRVEVRNMLCFIEKVHNRY